MQVILHLRPLTFIPSSLSLVRTHTPTHECTHIHTHTRPSTWTPALAFAHAHTHALFLSLLLTFYLSLTMSLFHSLSLSLVQLHKYSHKSEKCSCQHHEDLRYSQINKNAFSAIILFEHLSCSFLSLLLFRSVQQNCECITNWKSFFKTLENLKPSRNKQSKQYWFGTRC